MSKCITWHTTLYLAIVCAYGFVYVYAPPTSQHPRHEDMKKTDFPYNDNVKGVLLSIQLHAVDETQACVCQNTATATTEASTHTHPHPHTLITMWMERSVIVGCVKWEMEHLRLGDGWIVGDVNMEGGYRGCVSWFCLPL